MNSLTLYNYYRSSASYRVRIALNLKDLEYTYKPIHLLKDGGQQHRPEFQQMNPMSQTPCLVHETKSGPVVLSQSLAIIQYLDDIFPQKPLFPSQAVEKAICWQLCEIINSGIQPLQNLHCTQQLESQLSASSEQKTAWMQYWIQRGLHAFEQLLQKTSGKFCVGDLISAADCCLVAQVFSSQRFGIDTKDYPHIHRIYQECQKNPRVQHAHPNVQPDAEDMSTK